MAFPIFQARPPSLLPANTNVSTASRPDQTEQQTQLSVSDIQALFGITWRMIASSGSMWQDPKHTIKIIYTSGDSSAVEFNSEATWLGETPSKQSSTKGTNLPRVTETGYVYDWRGIGWLRLITTHWEIVGVGLIPGSHHGGSEDDATMDSSEKSQGSLVLVTFLQKTLFSPQTLSVLVQEEQLDGVQIEDVVKAVSAALRSQGVDSLSAEVEKLKILHHK